MYTRIKSRNGSKLLDQADSVFGSGQESKTVDEAQLKDLQAKLGEPELERPRLGGLAPSSS